MVGAVLACNVYLATSSPRQSKPVKAGIISTILCWIFTGLSVVQLIIPCIPPDGDVPPVAQHIATATIRTFASISIAFLLYRYSLTHSLTHSLLLTHSYLLTHAHSRCLVPAENTWHFSALNNILSWKYFEPLSQLTYASYLIHFRLLMVLLLTYSLFSLTLTHSPTHLLTLTHSLTHSLTY